MCGRYAATANPDELVEEFEVEQDRTAEPARSILKNPQSPPAGTPDFNLAPSKQAPVVLTRAPRATSGQAAPATSEGHADGPAPVRQLRLLTWGLVPSWAKDTKIGMRMINARAESVLEKGSFAKAAASRRCLVPAQGWYEWQKSPVSTDAKGNPRKQPFYMHRADGDVVAFAGLYEFWRDREIADGDDPQAWLTTFTIITTEAEAGLDRIHDRQPLVLEREDWSTWLDPSLSDPDEVARLLAFSAPGRFEAYPVGTAVSSNRSNGPQLIEPAGIDELDGVVDPLTGEIIGGDAQASPAETVGGPNPA
ncbi:putative SOS response-associated peptidase YedK [Phycicoccus badiiscoriae]|uniref:Abasic site processing protein n=1 Tax=Pedococcus badiiscoriae TaxID=642776 RepID=A0A852WA41_9MICO|nr:SOS response-associated peptidase [Pedococcus badiiscoriae]NYG06097.1 putative SOS response-associated peptidase YedK [Pedococcus badiiscoriae]